ncbi:acyltransferase [Chitinophaga niabensis]|uniref:Carbonic anhydrase or acetyltransferase, isoleucine patch superfamily n=1 Tax=Chitinophaga niabensis TaxID=536979 RepID=A0A1N6E3K7_9BACT|nr:acyltransferase [Chitinophaga niabensis]SIN77582.1 Carbonic anhydrase or acetyltransferase, isoleucine patch superfamily [Chitinophaga niabensis]
MKEEDTMKEKDFKESYFVHDLANVMCKAIGNGTRIWQFTVVLPGAVIGQECNINCNCFIENEVIIGNDVTIKSGVQVWDGVKIADNVFVGPNVTFTNDRVPKSKVYPQRFLQTHLQECCSIGANSTIICGVTIGAYAFIGAGSVVTKNIPPYTVWYGNPASHKGYITEDGLLLDMSLSDPKNGDQYKISPGGPIKIDVPAGLPVP